MAQKYLKRWDDRLDEAAAVFDDRADPRNRHQTVTRTQTSGTPIRRTLASLNLSSWGGWIRTTNLPVNSRALRQLSYTPVDGTAVITTPLIARRPEPRPIARDR